MSNLRKKNVEKCVDVLRNFCNSVDKNDGTMLEKKKEAGIALDHLNSLLASSMSMVRGGGDECKEQASSC